MSSETVAATFHKAVCSRCGEAPDLDGFEFQATPEKAVSIALTDEDSGFERIDGRLVCLDCREAVEQ